MSKGGSPTAERRPLVAHVVYRFDTGGLENGLVNLLNHMPAQAYRHAVISLTDITEFHRRVRRSDVEFVALHKPPGHALKLYPRLVQLFRALRPAIVHTRNLAALECVVPAWFAGVPVRVHGEHGRDVEDMDGSSRKYQWIRRAYRPWVTQYVALSDDLASYLRDRVGVRADAVSQIYNGVDTARFSPRTAVAPVHDWPFEPGRHWVIGTVGRMQAVKDQLTLARAFIELLRQRPVLRERVRLTLIGDGPLRAQAQALLHEAGLADACWLPGERADIPDLMRGLDCFVLPSLAEGISNTILEAMATGLPVIATAVGGNAELVADGRTGLVVPPADAPTLARALERLATDPALASGMGRAAREVAVERFSLQAMVDSYQAMYDRQLRGRAR